MDSYGIYSQFMGYIVMVMGYIVSLWDIIVMVMGYIVMDGYGQLWDRVCELV